MAVTPMFLCGQDAAEGVLPATAANTACTMASQRGPSNEKLDGSQHEDDAEVARQRVDRGFDRVERVLAHGDFLRAILPARGKLFAGAVVVSVEALPARACDCLVDDDARQPAREPIRSLELGEAVRSVGVSAAVSVGVVPSIPGRRGSAAEGSRFSAGPRQVTFRGGVAGLAGGAGRCAGDALSDRKIVFKYLILISKGIEYCT